MEFLNEFFLPPSSDHLHLVKYLILLVYFIHIPFMGLVLGGTTFSVFFRLLAQNDPSSRYWQVSKDFIEILVFRKSAGIILGVLPLIVLTLIEGQVFYDANISVVNFMMYTTLLVALGISMVYFYQSTFQMAEINPFLQLGGGLSAVGVLMLAYFIFSVNSALILDPGRWATVTNPTQFLFSWNVVARFLHFLTAAFAVSGVALLFFLFNWKELRQERDPDYKNYLRNLGGGIGLAFTLVQPILILWNLVTIPDQALNAAVFAYTIISLFILMLIAILLYRLLKESQITLGTNVFVLFIITLIIMIVSDHAARENAIENHTNLLTTRSDEIAAEIEAEREVLRSASIEPDLAVGKTVYDKQCTACHQFNQVLVGPPYNVVLPKYQDNGEELIKFIRNPYKIDANYPAMPKLGLSEKEIKSVVVYLYQELEKKQ
jgi:cytochrome c